MYYFFSYARADATPFLEKFYHDLREAVRSKTGVHDPDAVGFRDAQSIEPGSSWLDAIAKALSSCKVFVYLHSPTYFGRDGCGREFEKWNIRRANQRVIRFIRHHENDTAVFVLQHVALLSFVEARHDDVASLDKLQFCLTGIAVDYAGQHFGRPRSPSINERARSHDGFSGAAQIEQCCVPQSAFALRRNAACSGADICAALTGIDSVQYDQPCIVHAAIRIGKANSQILFERCPFLRPLVERHGSENARI
jgi:TIR domain